MLFDVLLVTEDFVSILRILDNVMFGPIQTSSGLPICIGIHFEVLEASRRLERCRNNYVFNVSEIVSGVIFVDFGGSLDDILIVRKWMHFLSEKPGRE